MRIQAIDLSNNRPLSSKKLTIKIKDKENLTLSTDTNGYFHLDDKYSGQPITASLDGLTGSSVTAFEGAKVMVRVKAEEKLK